MRELKTILSVDFIALLISSRIKWLLELKKYHLLCPNLFGSDLLPFYGLK